MEYYLVSMMSIFFSLILIKSFLELIDYDQLRLFNFYNIMINFLIQSYSASQECYTSILIKYFNWIGDAYAERTVNNYCRRLLPAAS